MEHKLRQFERAIAREAARIGLVFVSGPDTAPVSAPVASEGVTSGQRRGVLLIGVAEE